LCSSRLPRRTSSTLASASVASLASPDISGVSPRTLAILPILLHIQNRAPAVFALVLVVAFLLGCPRSEEEGSQAATASSGAAAITVPRPDLSAAEEAVRRELEQQVVAVEEFLANVERPPGDLARALGDLGRLYHAYDFIAAARSCYEGALELVPGEFLWTYYLGFLDQTQGDLEKAAARFEGALAARPNDLPTLLRLARTRLALSELDAAAGLFTQALELDPRSAAAHEGLGKIAASRGDHRSALEHLEKALKEQPKASTLHYLIAQSQRALGNEEEAKRHLSQSGTLPVGFRDPLVAALDAQVVGTGLHLTRGGVALAEGRTEEALEEFREAVADDPASVPARLNLAALLEKTGDLTAAKSELEEAARIEPENAPLRLALGRLLAREGRDQEAIEQFRQVLERDPDFEAAHFHLGTALGRLGDFEGAVEALSRVLELNPESLAARYQRALVELELSQFDAAAEDLQRVVESDPANAPARLYLGQALRGLGRLEEALETYGSALALELRTEERALTHLGIGNLHAARGEWEAAIAAYRDALASEGDLLQARVNLAGSLSFVGRHDEAAAQYRRVLAEAPEDTTLRFHFASTLMRLGRFEEAVGEFERIIEIEPGHQRARVGEAAALTRLGRASLGRERLEEAHRRLPESVLVTQALARFLASCSDRKERDGDRALEMAFALLEAEKSLENAETLAMALAETGRYEEAAKWQREVISQAEGTARGEQLELLRGHLALYERGAPCCEPPS
jgi:tetratricopeptide (TPR) repeat protein